MQLKRQFINTTVGRVIFNDHLPDEMPFINGLIKKKGVQQLVYYCYLRFGLERTVRALDQLKELGFLYATKSGISIGIEDMLIPGDKAALVEATEREIVKVQQQYLDGAITNGERYNKVIAIWSDVTEKVAEQMFKALEQQDKEGVINPIYVMADSGARGSKQQIRQLSGMRGLMAKPSGEVIETPITSNFREGLTVLQYFISTHGARKGLADTALKTADSGYLTRRLVDVAQDVIINEIDCGTGDGIYVEPILEAGVEVEPLRDRVVGRVSLERIKDYEGNAILEVNQEITEELANAIQAAGIERVKIRSVLTCESRRGVCARCYGRNLATGRMVELGEAVGVIAAQSIGEPGTQLTMRTFHIGGTATRIAEQSKVESRSNGFVRFIDLKVGPRPQQRADRHEPLGPRRHRRRKGPRKRALPRRLRRAPARGRRPAGHRRPDPGRMGSLHLLDPHRNGRQHPVQGPAARHHHRGAGRRSHRLGAARRYAAARRRKAPAHDPDPRFGGPRLARST